MKVVQLTSSLSRTAGGPFESIRRQSQELALLGCRVAALGVMDEFTREDSSLWQPVTTYSYPTVLFRSFSYAPGLRQGLASLQPDVVHSHGIWLYHQLVAYRYAAVTGRPLIVSPRGMLEQWAFQHNRLKKLPLWWLYEKRGLQLASVLHATSHQEAESFRALQLTAPIAVIPNGVDLPECGAPNTDNGKTALFLSRIHAKKGLLNLVEAWRIVRPKGWKVIIAGPDENDHEREVKNAVKRSGLGDCFEFVGPVYGEGKARLYQRANLFVLPSYSENFGNVVAEALAYGVPVITTSATPWSEIRDYGCGWWVDVGVTPLAEALSAAVAAGDNELKEMGARGRKLVESRYAWPWVAAEMKKVYQWAVAGGHPPDSVRLNW